MNYAQNMRDISNHATAIETRRLAAQMAGPRTWEAQLVTLDDGALVVRVRKEMAWTQAPVTNIDPPAWGEFAPFPSPLPDRKVAKAITKGVR